MCGIAGFVNKRGESADHAKLLAMTDAVAHRGPDAQGQLCVGNVALGHRRLAIVDLSEAGTQPMESGDGRFVITYNGEIYNYMELKEELAAAGAEFHNSTDTEVILEAYRFWGRSCVQRFNGMWAFVLWDRRANELFISRDRFAVKPLYILDREDLFMFASEAKAILAAEPEENIPDLVSIHRFIASTAPENIDERSWYENIKIFPAATNGIYSLHTNELKMETYWTPDYRAFHDKWIAGGNPIQTFRELFDSAVGLRLRADVEVGTCLSGGLDSSAIVGCCSKRHGRIMHTFSSRYADKSCDEGEYIDAANSFSNSIPHPIFPDDASDGLVETLRRIIWNHDGPPAGASLYSGYCVYREVSKTLKVTLDGQGADELFGGYIGFWNPHLGRLAHCGKRLKGLWALTILLAESDAMDISALSADVGVKLFGIDQFSRLKKTAVKETSAREKSLRVHASVTNDFLHEAGEPSPPTLCVSSGCEDEVGQMCFNSLLHFSIPRICHNVDGNAMEFSVEPRMPFLDYRLVEFGLALGSDYKLRGIWQKWILRKALRKYLPASIRRRRHKMGFPAPFSRWLRESSEKDALREIIFSLAARNIVPEETIRAHYDAHMQGSANLEQILFRYCALELWLRTCTFIKING